MVYDVCVIGAGITGSAIARELSRYRLKILLLEKEIEPAFGVSKSNSGIIHSGTQNPPDSLKGRLCVEGNRLMRETISRELGLNFVQCGQLIAAMDAEDVERLKKIIEDGAKLGVEGLKLVDRKWLDEHEPNLSKEVRAAVLSPTAGIISPYRYVYALVENAVANGVTLKTGVRVTGIKRRAEKGFRITAGDTVFEADRVVNASGLYADEISAMAGVADFRITPRKGEEYLLDKKREHMANHIIFPLPSKTSKGILIIKTSDGNPMIGPTAEDTGDKADLSTTEEGLSAVLSSVKRMMPSVEKSDIIACFAGLRPVAGKDFIIRGEEKCPGFINAAGMQSPGLTAAPAVALHVAGLLAAGGLELKKKENFKKYREKPVHLFQIPLSRTRELIEKDPAYGDIVCRCEMVSAKEIREAVKRGARTLDGVKFRTRAQAGRCHGGFCTTRILKILSEELGTAVTSLTKRGGASKILKREKDGPA